MMTQNQAIQEEIERMERYKLEEKERKYRERIAKNRMFRRENNNRETQ